MYVSYVKNIALDFEVICLCILTPKLLFLPFSSMLASATI